MKQYISPAVELLALYAEPLMASGELEIPNVGDESKPDIFLNVEGVGNI